MKENFILRRIYIFFGKRNEYVDVSSSLLRATYRKFCTSLLSWTSFSLNVNLFTTLVYVVYTAVHYNWNFSVRFTSFSLSAAKRNKWKAVFAKEILKTRVLLLCSNNYANYCSRFHDLNLNIYIYFKKDRVCKQLNKYFSNIFQHSANKRL